MKQKARNRLSAVLNGDEAKRFQEKEQPEQREHINSILQECIKEVKIESLGFIVVSTEDVIEILKSKMIQP